MQLKREIFVRYIQRKLKGGKIRKQSGISRRFAKQGRKPVQQKK